MNYFWRTILLVNVLLALSAEIILRLPFNSNTLEMTRFIIFLFFGAVSLFVIQMMFLRKEKMMTIPLNAKRVIFSLFFTGFISCLFSISSLTSLIGIFPFFTGGLIYSFFWFVYLIAAYQIKSEKTIILQSIVLTAFFVSVWGLYEHFLHRAEPWRISSFIGQPNRLAAYILITLPIAVSLLRKNKKLTEKVFYLSGIVLMLAAFILTGSISNFAGAILVAIILLLSFSQRINKSLVTIGMFGLIVLLFLVFRAKIMPVLTNLNKSSLQLRIAEMQDGWQIFAKAGFGRKLFGFGGDTVYFSYFKYRPLVFNQSAQEVWSGATAIRNQYLNTLITSGLSGLAVYLIFYGYVLKSAFRGKDLLDQGIYGSLIAIGIGSIFYYQFDVVLALFAVLSGLAISNNRMRTKRPFGILISHRIREMVKLAVVQDTYRLLRNGLGFMTLLFPLLAIYGVIVMAVAHSYYQSSGSNTIRIATEINPYFDVYWRDLSAYYYQNLVANENKPEMALEYYRLENQAISRALTLAPLDMRNIRQKVTTDYYAGVSLDKSIQVNNIPLAIRFTQISPNTPLSWDMLGLTYLNLGQLENARLAFENEQKTEDSVEVNLHLGEVVKQSGNLPLAIKYYQRAVQMAPDFKLAKDELAKAEKLIVK